MIIASKYKQIYILIMLLSIIIPTTCAQEDEYEKEYEKEYARYLLAEKVIVQTKTPDLSSVHRVFSTVLAHKYLRPFMLSIYNGTDVDFILAKHNIGLKLPSDEQIYAANAGFLIPGSLLFLLGCADLPYIKGISLLASLALLWQTYNAHVFFERKVLKDDQSITIKPGEQIEVIIVVDDRDFKGSVDIFLENKQGRYMQGFRIDIVQNGCVDKYQVMFGDSNYE